MGWNKACEVVKGVLHIDKVDSGRCGDLSLLNYTMSLLPSGYNHELSQRPLVGTLSISGSIHEIRNNNESLRILIVIRQRLGRAQTLRFA